MTTFASGRPVLTFDCSGEIAFLKLPNNLARSLSPPLVRKAVLAADELAMISIRLTGKRGRRFSKL